MRYFNGKEVELLAPAGNFQIFKELAHTRCDAYYLGGKKFNMRMHRENFNFSDHEIKAACEASHEKEKKLYITVNNLLNENELSLLTDYLFFLSECKVDGIIFQDMAVLDVVHRNNIPLVLHSSVMMNVHNLEMIKKLRKKGVSRVVTSRETSLEAIKRWSSLTDMEFEYFVHGDMCSAVGSQCYYSGIIFGQSSNRGLCMKPCRWNYKMKHEGQRYSTEYPLAVKDMYMYEHIPEMIHAGICSFKIEGRMRDSSYTKGIIHQYSQAIDRYIEDPIYYNRLEGAEILYDQRNRDFSTAFAFGNPGLDYINRRYEGTGYFYSTGKVFSKPIEEHSISLQATERIKSALPNAEIPHKGKKLLSVRADTLEQLKCAVKNNVDLIYINGVNLERDNQLSLEEIAKVYHSAGNSRLILSMPHSTSDSDLERFDSAFSDKNQKFVHGIMATNTGAVESCKKYGMDLYGDYTLNIYNHGAAEYYTQEGLKNITLSPEINTEELRDILRTVKSAGMEIIVHGSPTVMYLQLDLYEHLSGKEAVYPESSKYYNDSVLTLVDDKEMEHPVYRDSAGNSHVLLYKDICLLPILNTLASSGIGIFRLEIAHYDLKSFENIIQVYRKALEDPSKTAELWETLIPEHMDHSFGALNF